MRRISIVMERTPLASRWADEKWEAKGAVSDSAPAGAAPRVLVERDGLRQLHFGGCEVRLVKSEAQGYFLNLTSPHPMLFVLWRMVEGVATPAMLTVSYDEGTRWADSGEQVDGVPLPAELVPWMVEFVEAHYRPEPRKPKRYASSKDRGVASARK